MNIAIDCKQTEFEVTVIAPCEVAGVAYGAGETIRMATKEKADKLVKAGAALHNVRIMQPVPVEVIAAPEPIEEKPSKGFLGKRLERSKKGKS